MIRKIKKVAVIGAGVMGSGIAAHLANAGVRSVMLDVVPRQLTEEEKAKGLDLSSPVVRSRIARVGLEAALASKPALFYSKEDAKLVKVGNVEDDWQELADADWIIEVVKEEMGVKKHVFGRIADVRKEGSIITSNTSGLSITGMTEGLPEEMRRHFLVTHFFNPVRYMKLLELVRGPETDPEVVDFITSFGEDYLGKGIVFGKDTPNFVANRIGVYSMLAVIKHMVADGYKVEEVDKICGPALGRPRSAAFRTADLVGLDTFIHVADNVYENLPQDEEREVFKVPEFMREMVKRGMLGEKTKQGFYRVDKSGGGKNIQALDVNTLEYRDQIKVRYDSLGEAKGIEDVGERIKALVSATDRAGQFAWKVVRDSIIYAANRIPEIADDVVNVDHAMRWGFNWDLGPFETWDALGVEQTVKRMEADGKAIPQNVRNVLEKGQGSFYTKDKGKISYFDLAEKTYKDEPVPPWDVRLWSLKEQNKEIASNFSAGLLDLGDGVLCLEFRSKMNAIDNEIIDMMNQALDMMEQKDDYVGLVIGNQGQNFSVGANLMMMWGEAVSGNFDNLDRVVKAFQNANMRLRYSPKPVVAAPFNLTLGGGCEVTLHADRVRAAGELYIGLVEVGVGLIPAGGGTKEYLIRCLADLPSDPLTDPFPFVRKAFEAIGMAKVATSAKEARAMRFLGPGDQLTINKERLIHDAKHTVLAMVQEGYTEPRPREDLRLPGLTGYATMELGLYQMKMAGYISDHDELIGKKLAYVLCGGETTPQVPVSEQYILDLEREAFLSLVGTQKTQDRMNHMLMKGKPLRN